MADIEITDFALDNYRGAGSAAYLQIVSEGPWVDVDGDEHAALSYDEIELEVNTGTHRIDETDFFLTPTQNARVNQLVTLRFQVVDANRKNPLTLASGVSVPYSTPVMAWGSLRLLAQSQSPWRDVTSPTTTDMVNYVQQQLGAVVYPPATASTIGGALASVPPANPAFPKFVGDNDLRVGVDSADYTSLSEAVTAIGATPTTLVITSAFPSGASCTVPATLTLKFIPGQGSIVRGSGHTVTIRSSTKDWPVAQIFSGPGVVSFSGNRAVGDIWPEWWGAVCDDATDCTAALTEMFHLAEYNGSITGARFKLSDGIYRHTGLTYRGDFQHAFILEGQAAGAGLSGSIIKYTGASGGTIFQILGATDCIVRNVAFHGNELAKYGVLLDYDASRAQGSFNCTLDNIAVGGVVGVDSACVVTGTSAFASAEHTFIHPVLVGHSTPGTTYYGILNLGNANAKNYRVKTGSISGFKWGVSLSGSGYHQIDGVSFGYNTEGDVKPGSAQLSLRDVGSEGSTRFIDGRAASSIGTITVEVSYWSGATVGDDYFIIYSGMLTLIGNDFYNARNATSLPAIQLPSIGGAPNTNSLVSINNYYVRPDGSAVPTALPLYDGNGNNLSLTHLDGSDPTFSAFNQILSFGDKSRPISGNTDYHYPVRMTGRQTYVQGISQTATPSKNLRGSVTFTGAATKAVTFAVAEPDADFKIVLSGNAQETFSWSAKGTGGFTITSSNAASVATVDWILVR